MSGLLSADNNPRKMLLQRGPVILSPANNMAPQTTAVENVEPKISQIVDNLIGKIIS